MLLASSFRTIALNTDHIEDHRMMEKTINSSHSGHRIFKDSFPFTENEIRRDHNGLAFISLSKECEEHLHFVTILLDIPNIVENHTGKFIQFGKLLWQTQISFRRQKALDKRTGSCPTDGMASLNDSIPNSC